MEMEDAKSKDTLEDEGGNEEVDRKELRNRSSDLLKKVKSGPVKITENGATRMVLSAPKITDEDLIQ